MCVKECLGLSSDVESRLLPRKGITERYLLSYLLVKMESEPPPSEAITESPSTQSEEPNKDPNSTANAPNVPTAASAVELAAPPIPSVIKDTQKSNSKKPKKRKPRIPRDVTAPRQPLTGNRDFFIDKSTKGSMSLKLT